MEMGEKIYNLRKEKGLTLEELGNLVGVGKSTVRKWEKGMIANMKRDKISKLASALSVSPAYLMGWEERDDDDNIWGFGIFPEEIDEYVHSVGEFLYYNPNHRPLFDSIMEVKTEDIGFAKQMLDRINGKYHENDIYLNAAHERTDIEVTDEMKKHDEDIMDDDNF